MNDKEKRIKMDDEDKKIIVILIKHPEGMSYRGIWNRLIDEKGEHLIAFQTLQRRVDRLKSKGMVGVKDAKKQGSNAVITLTDDGRVVGKKLSKNINYYKEAFRRYIENYRSKSTPEKLNKIWVAGSYIEEMLDEEMKEVLNDDMSDNLKRELVYAIIEEKAEVEKMGVDLCLEDEICNRVRSSIQGLSREELLEKLNEQIKSSIMDNESLKMSVKKKLMEEEGLSEEEAEKYAEMAVKKDDELQEFRDSQNKDMEFWKEWRKVRAEVDELIKKIEREGYK